MKPGKHEGIVGLWECFIWGISSEHISSEHISSPLSACLRCASWQTNRNSPAAPPLLLPKTRTAARQTDPATLARPKATGKEAEPPPGLWSQGAGRERVVWQGYGPLTAELDRGEGYVMGDACQQAGCSHHR